MPAAFAFDFFTGRLCRGLSPPLPTTRTYRSAKDGGVSALRRAYAIALVTLLQLRLHATELVFAPLRRPTPSRDGRCQDKYVISQLILIDSYYFALIFDAKKKWLHCYDVD